MRAGSLRSALRELVAREHARVGTDVRMYSGMVSADGSRDGVGRTESGSASWTTAICAPSTRRARACARRDRCAHVQRHGQCG